MQKDNDRSEQQLDDRSQTEATAKREYAKPELLRLGLLRRLTRFSF
jgi:hypothetical protein